MKIISDNNSFTITYETPEEMWLYYHLGKPILPEIINQ